MKMKNCFLPLFLCVAFIPLHAQDDEAQIRQLLHDLANSVNSAQTLQDAKNIRNFFTPAYTAIRTDFLPDGSTKSQNVTLDVMGTRISGFVSDVDQKVEYKLGNINFLKILGNTAVANYNADFSISNKGDLVYSGSSNTTSKLVKTDSGWKIASATTAEVRDNVQRYVCNYELFKKDNTSSLIKVTYPAGTNFQTEYINVDIQNIQDSRYIVKTDKGDQFDWVNGKIDLPNPETGMTQSLTAANEIGVYNQLVTHYYPHHCSGAERGK